MSRLVAALVYSRRIGSMPRKSILAYCAERASDDGSGIWASKQRIADEVECSKQTVITTMRALMADGLLTETGTRRSPNGYTVEYAINIAAVAALPSAQQEFEGVQIWTGEGSKSGPVGSRTLTGGVKELDPNRPKPSSLDTSVSKLSERRLALGVDDEAWQAFIDMRKKIKAPLTDRAEELAIGELEKLAQAGNDPLAVVEQSTMKSWRGLFEIKDGHANGSGQQWGRQSGWRVLSQKSHTKMEGEHDHFD